eukprot:SAG22_NODE_272_length_13192_cov_311.812495_10_plen_434_part_00
MLLPRTGWLAAATALGLAWPARAGQILWSGGVTDRLASFRVECCVDSLEADTFLLYRDLADPEGAASAVLTVAVERGITAIDSAPLPNRLQPDTQYYYGLRASLAKDAAYFGTFRTMPPSGQPANFSFVFASCAYTGSNHAVFDSVRQLRPAVAAAGGGGSRQEKPLFFLHMGDLHYEDISDNNVELFKAAYLSTWESQTQSALYRSGPVVYMWDDHDFGPNDSNGESESRAAARAAYRMFVPHHELAVSDGANTDAAIYHAFTVGRVRYLVLDLRSESEDPADEATWQEYGSYPSMLGRRQRDWLQSELEGHVQWGLMVLVSSKPWSGVDSDPDCCKWMHYPDERTAVANMIAANGVDNLVAVAGDAHMLAYDDGSNTDYSSLAAADNPAGFGAVSCPGLHSWAPAHPVPCLLTGVPALCPGERRASRCSTR